MAANMRIQPEPSLRELLPRVSVVVTTGSSDVVLAALSAGLPMVVVPRAWDEPANAQRVRQTGAGIALSPRKCTPKRLRRAVQHVLEEPSFAASAGKLAAAFAASGGPAAAAVLLERLVADAPFVPPQPADKRMRASVARATPPTAARNP
jgi:UDP:flavonoid glycosyltransferase YjiC (YdhE family)